MTTLTQCDGCGTTEPGAYGWLKGNVRTRESPQKVILQGEFHSLDCFTRSMQEAAAGLDQAQLEQVEPDE